MEAPPATLALHRLMAMHLRLLAVETEELVQIVYLAVTLAVLIQAELQVVGAQTKPMAVAVVRQDIQEMEARRELLAQQLVKRVLAAVLVAV